MMLQEAIRSALLRFTARKYAHRLQGRLRRDYGISEYYTVKQIQAAVRKAGLPLRYIAIGYAAFMPEHAFMELAGIDGDYQRLRALFQRYAKSDYQPGFAPAPENPYAVSGYDPSGPR